MLHLLDRRVKSNFDFPYSLSLSLLFHYTKKKKEKKIIMSDSTSPSDLLMEVPEVKPCSLGLKNVHPEGLERNVEEMLNVLMKDMTKQEMISTLNEITQGEDTEQVCWPYI